MDKYNFLFPGKKEEFKLDKEITADQIDDFVDALEEDDLEGLGNDDAPQYMTEAQQVASHLNFGTTRGELARMINRMIEGGEGFDAMKRIGDGWEYCDSFEKNDTGFDVRDAYDAITSTSEFDEYISVKVRGGELRYEFKRFENFQEEIDKDLGTEKPVENNWSNKHALSGNTLESFKKMVNHMKEGQDDCTAMKRSGDGWEFCEVPSDMKIHHASWRFHGKTGYDEYKHFFDQMKGTDYIVFKKYTDGYVVTDVGVKKTVEKESVEKELVDKEWKPWGGDKHYEDFKRKYKCLGSIHGAIYCIEDYWYTATHINQLVSYKRELTSEIIDAVHVYNRMEEFPLIEMTVTKEGEKIIGYYSWLK